MWVLALLAAGGGVWTMTGHAGAPRVRGAWQDVRVLGDVSPGEMDIFMRAMNASLGVDCEYCHEEGSWHLETRPEKEIARSMMRMITRLSNTGFEVLDVPTCWTCHRGNRTPRSEPSTLSPEAPAYPPFTFSTSVEAAGEVYDNIEQYAALPAADLEDVMEGYARALGVGCDYCHVPGDWPNDEKVEKLLARRMLESQTAIEEEFFAGGPEISCWSCHQGQAVPAMSLPSELLSP